MEKITFKNSPLTLVGEESKIGDKAPEFSVVDKSLKEVKLKDFAGKIKVFTIFPSIDTPVCDMQVRGFNKRASALSGDIVVIGVSKDLPFALSRFCAAAGIDRVVTLSDYQNSSFGENYGLLIKELNLLARAVLIVDKEDKIVYRQVVTEVTNQPNYEEVFNKLTEVVG